MGNRGNRGKEGQQGCVPRPAHAPGPSASIVQCSAVQCKEEQYGRCKYEVTLRAKRPQALLSAGARKGPR